MPGAPAIRRGCAALALTALGGCVDAAQAPADRPAPKPAKLAVQFVDRAGPTAKLARAHVSTKSGDILILEQDGSVTTTDLDSPSGRNALTVSESDLAALNVNLGLDLRGVAPDDPALGGLAGRVGSGETEQERALAAFAARTKPAFPSFPAGFKAPADAFHGAEVARFAGDKRGDLVQVTANLRPGLDDKIAFAYATCALAGWAREAKIPFARQVLTTQKKRDGMVQIDAVFTLSHTQPLGLRVMDTNDTLRDCKESGIPAATGGTSKHG